MILKSFSLVQTHIDRETDIEVNRWTDRPTIPHTLPIDFSPQLPKL